MLKRWYLPSFLPVRGQTLVNYTIFSLFEPIFCLGDRKKRWYLRVFQKIEDRDVYETLQITVFYPLSEDKTVVFTRFFAI